MSTPVPNVPVFVVVGNVNQGKSSVVAALTENEAIPIDRYPGTTRHSGTYVFRAGERELFRIVDTPGFQEARAALAWLSARAASAAERRSAVEAFVAEHRKGPRFVDEVELLEPILGGAGILYVVDGSSRFQPANEAEMEILRWTGQPGMALINRIKANDHAAEWRPILEQFFNIVREFDAHRAGFQGRVDLLRGFGELRADWRAPIDEAVRAVQDDWETRRRRAAEVIAEATAAALGHVELRRLREGDDEKAARDELVTAWRDALRKSERDARTEVERIFRHEGLERLEGEVEVLAHDLFSDTTWKLFGLTRTQLTAYAAFAGAAVGGVVDAFTLGASFLTGAGIGAVVGAGAAWFGGTEIARAWGSGGGLARALLPGETGRFLAMGPVTSARFAWVFVDRALLHYRAVRDRSHARRDALEVETGPDGKAGLAASLPGEPRKALDEALRGVMRAAAKGGGAGEARRKLAKAVEGVLRVV